MLHRLGVHRGRGRAQPRVAGHGRRPAPRARVAALLAGAHVGEGRCRSAAGGDRGSRRAGSQGGSDHAASRKGEDMKVLAAMSGGVDSAVAAARAVDAGHEVVGVHLALSAKPGTLRTGARGCCTIEDARDARRVADLLGIPFYVWDFAERFTEDVIETFVGEYAAGRTPNPCVTCNEKIKFEALLEKAIALGFDAVVTGHYARLRIVDGVPELRRSADEGKDQSYVLASLSAEQLRHAMFPLGDSVKSEVRAEAAERGLMVADKPDSHDICFIPDGNTKAFLESRLGRKPGKLVDAKTGAVLGEHTGIHGFTVGQRKGLGIEAPAPDGRPRYVLALEPVSGTVKVGSAEDLGVRVIE